MARTVLQLGAELISSDGTAFYELIKNAFDAISPNVTIDIVIRIPYNAYKSHMEFVQQQQTSHSNSKTMRAVMERRNAILQDFDVEAPHTDRIRKRISEATTWEQLGNALDNANYIKFTDTGCGMTLDDLQEDFLTIGTRSRLLQHERQQKTDSSNRPILGEKGLGRLSTMRLGWRLRVNSSTKGETNWNRLKINWRLFSHESDALVEDIVLQPVIGDAKEEPEISGTEIVVFGLKSQWTEEKVREIAASEFNRLTDPFISQSRYPISLRFNEQPVAIPILDKILFEQAHAKVRAEYSIDKEIPILKGHIDYSLRKREKAFSIDQINLLSITKTKSNPKILNELGPFSVEFYWFNRRILEAVEGIGDKKTVQKLVNNWSGGLMVFRDGFRVNPYGSPNDDWLDLDRKALASSGYKVNRKQIVGRVCISRRGNAELTDQTNRQGLRDCDEKQALITILKHILEAQFRAFITKVDDDLRARSPISLENLSERIEEEEKQVKKGVELLYRRFPEVKEDIEVVDMLEGSVKRINDLIREVEKLGDSLESDRAKLVYLAGLGLIVEIVAHELNRATRHALSTLAESEFKDLGPNVSDRLDTLQAQLKTLQKRLRILDPLSDPGRQVKEDFDLISWVEDIVSSHEAQFKRHEITCTVRVEPERKPRGMPVKMVKGMIVQILENLLVNSVYWLEQKSTLDDNFSPSIDVVIDTKTRRILVTDNGPGIPTEQREEVFQPFVTTKPPGEGKGLGLYISREIALYHGATLVLSEEPSINEDRLNTFIFTLEAGQE
jgi:signal transduction histidine kinase